MDLHPVSDQKFPFVTNYLILQQWNNTFVTYFYFKCLTFIKCSNTLYFEILTYMIGNLKFVFNQFNQIDKIHKKE